MDAPPRREALDQEVARHEVSPGAWLRIERRLRPRAWRWAGAVTAVAVVVAAVAVAVPYLRRSRHSLHPLPPDPVGIAAAGGRIWVTENSETRPCVVRIDPATNRTTGSPVTVSVSPVSIVSGAGSLWVTSGRGGFVDRIDPATGAVTAAWSIQNVDAVGAGSLWVTTGDGIQRIDPATGALTATITLPSA